ncbi:hypothetical protein Ciccas_002140 [Cichlidogyrus casuarinus]|uniref:Uncharacterized protein n=1 Tax=Cichlidogyrus casuarinus TaxID=1844966 RepID=A0ABD2QI32_9PLAT
MNKSTDKNQTTPGNYLHNESQLFKIWKHYADTHIGEDFNKTLSDSILVADNTNVTLEKEPTNCPYSSFLLNQEPEQETGIELIWACVQLSIALVVLIFQLATLSHTIITNGPNSVFLTMIMYYSRRTNEHSSGRNRSDALLIISIIVVLLSIISGSGQLIISLLTFVNLSKISWISNWLARCHIVLGVLCLAFMPLFLALRDDTLRASITATGIRQNNNNPITDERKTLRSSQNDAMGTDRQLSNHTYASLLTDQEQFFHSKCNVIQNGTSALCFTPISVSNVFFESSILSSQSDQDTNSLSLGTFRVEPNPIVKTTQPLCFN